MKKIFFLVILSSLLHAQIRITSVQTLPIPGDEQWHAPRFSPSGEEIFLTNGGYHGIWQYHPVTRLLKLVTADKHSGFGFSFSEDGSSIAYRRTVTEGDHRTRKQEGVTRSLKTGTSNVVSDGNSVMVPSFINNTIAVPEKIGKEDSPTMPVMTDALILGIENAKISIIVSGKKIVFDPFGDGQYVWPVLSPDRKKIAAVEMDRGAFVCNIDGTNIIRLGKCNAPQWTRSGRWIIGMEDVDDGHDIIGSELIALSPDGKQRVRLTETPSRHEMFPAPSPVENKIAATTSDGTVLLFTYEEGR